MLATSGFAIETKVARDVVIAGESFELDVLARDADNKPVQRKLSLSVLRRAVVDGKVGETEVQSAELQTDEKGRVRHTLKLADGGQFVLRVSGEDRFKNSIVADRVVRVSDDSDQVRLRILADTHSYKVGDTAKVNVHWRQAPALALVTHQGARILDYRLVTLKRGNNVLPIPMTAKLAPNFELSVTVMTDDRPAEDAKPTDDRPARFHAVSAPFRVERQLNVALEIRPVGDGADPPRPGDEVEIVVTTTDPQGKPVAAELSLAMVEASLLERFPSRVAAIQDFFSSAARQPAVRTTSSVRFRYRPTTKAINAKLLAEADRIEVEAAEAGLIASLETMRLGVVDTPDEWRSWSGLERSGPDAPILGSLGGAVGGGGQRAAQPAAPNGAAQEAGQMGQQDLFQQLEQDNDADGTYLNALGRTSQGRGSIRSGYAGFRSQRFARPNVNDLQFDFASGEFKCWTPKASISTSTRETWATMDKRSSAS